MPKNTESSEDKMLSLLQNLLAIELWRGGLSQAEIRVRLGVSMVTITKMLKGVSRKVQSET